VGVRLSQINPADFGDGILLGGIAFWLVQEGANSCALLRARDA